MVPGTGSFLNGGGSVLFTYDGCSWDVAWGGLPYVMGTTWVEAATELEI